MPLHIQIATQRIIHYLSTLNWINITLLSKFLSINLWTVKYMMFRWLIDCFQTSSVAILANILEIVESYSVLHCNLAIKKRLLQALQLPAEIYLKLVGALTHPSLYYIAYQRKLIKLKNCTSELHLHLPPCYLSSISTKFF